MSTMEMGTGDCPPYAECEGTPGSYPLAVWVIQHGAMNRDCFRSLLNVTRLYILLYPVCGTDLLRRE